jgi:hypothetical protein
MAAYENGIGAMSAKARMSASEKGYENGLGAMSAEERMACPKYDGTPETILRIIT